MQGRCACGEVAYRLAGRPFAVHCCHCRSCQRRGDLDTLFGKHDAARWRTLRDG